MRSSDCASPKGTNKQAGLIHVVVVLVDDGDVDPAVVFLVEAVGGECPACASTKDENSFGHGPSVVGSDVTAQGRKSCTLHLMWAHWTVMSIDVSGVSFHYPDGTPAVDELSFRARSGAVTAIVGPNGVGKTTLLELIAGDLEPAEGVISVDGQLAYMRQNPGFDGVEQPTVSDALALGLPGEMRDQYQVLRDLYTRAASDVDAGMAIGDALDRWSGLGGYEVEAGFDQITRAVLRQGYDEARDRPLIQLSGGERKRVILSSFLASPVPVLILDEPDNFLDLDGKAWLERELLATKKTVLMVSHDRTLLSAAVDRILVLEHNASWMHGGTYATLPTARRDRAEKLAKDLDRWHEEERRLFRYYKLMKQRASISPDMAKRADAAETRWERFRDAGPPTAPPPEREITTRFVGSRSGKAAMTATGLEVPDLFLPFDLTVWNEERVLLLGENGVGKSTLLRMLRDVAGASGTDLDDSPVRFGPTREWATSRRTTG